MPQPEKTLIEWLLNHDTWKPLVDLMGDWKAIVGFLVAGGSAIGAAWRWGAGFRRWLMSKFRPAQPIPPSESAAASGAAPGIERPLRFVTDDALAGWRWATLGQQQGMHVHGRWHVTNLSDHNFMILKARIEGREAQSSFVSTRAVDMLTPPSL
jgi:hypothetical protein